ncbi:hypothetical protein GQ44DRAFT_688232 [Phaeosphaeriaceae sp. PMI808]|nr:hypothetical protein GQ44DRAFT_688232 [Phaeosphaeriaceae sp. PMI808]
MKSEPTPAYPPYGANPHAANPYAQAHAAAPPLPLDSRPVNQQYRSHATPAFAPAHVPDERPQFATFDSQRKPVNEDALPAMPSWGDARDRRVEVEEQAVPQKRGDMELDRLDPNGSTTGGSATAMAAVGGQRRSPAPARSPVSPIDGYGYDQGFEKEPLVGAGPHRSPYSSPAPPGRPYAQQDEYRRGSPAQNRSPVHGAREGYAQGQHHDRRSPAQSQPDSYDRYDQRDAYGHQDSYSQAPPPSYRTNSPPTQNAYNNYDNYNNHSTSNVPYDNYSTNNVPYDNHNTSSTPYDNYGAAPAQPHSLTPGYTQPEPKAHEPSEPVSAYPGQRSYTPQSSYPGQTSYQAFNPGQTGPQSTGVMR